LAEHFKGGWISIDDVCSYGTVEYGRSTDFEDINDRIRHNQEFSTNSITHEIYDRQG